VRVWDNNPQWKKLTQKMSL